MAYISNEKSERSEFYNSVSAKDRVQDKNLSQIKFKVNDIYKKDETITTNFDAVNDECVKNRVF